MGIFTRFKDIVNSNINAMLDRAENPEKLIRLMIREMEDTLVELKASCAGIIAEGKKMERRLDGLRSREKQWRGRADLAVEKGRDDLAREALIEKRRFSEMIQSLEKDAAGNDGLIEQYQSDIRQLEEKLVQAREKQRMLVQRHVRARQARRAQEEIRRADNHDTMAKFDDLENRIERMEAEADLVNFGRDKTLADRFDELAGDDEIERELAAIKASKIRTGASGT